MNANAVLIPIVIPPRPQAIAEREIGSPLVITNERLFRWLVVILGEAKAKETLKEIPELNHVCWTLEQDDALARLANDEAQWRRQALRYMQAIEDQVRANR